MRQQRAIGIPIALYSALANDPAFSLSVAISSDAEDPLGIGL